MIIKTIDKDSLLNKMRKLQEKYQNLHTTYEDNEDKYHLASVSGTLYGILQCMKLVYAEDIYLAKGSDKVAKN